MNSWDLVQVIMSSGTIQISYWFGKSRSRSRLKKAQLRNNCFYTLSILYRKNTQPNYCPDRSERNIIVLSRILIQWSVRSSQYEMRSDSIR